MGLQRLSDFSALGELTVIGPPPGHASPSEVMYPGGPSLDGGLLAPGDPIPENAGPGGRRPDWLKVRIGVGETYASVNRLMRAEALHTVCEEARCPNQGECWALGTATFMVLGSVCTRNCGFCAIDTGRPPVTDLDEPRRVAEAARLMNLKHAVVTMVARDDLPDGGAGIIAETIRQIRLASPGTSIEVLISDLNGREADIRTVVEAQPEILNHNVETVPRLQRAVRRRARWDRSVGVLTTGRAIAREIGFDDMVTKTGLMLGLGEIVGRGARGHAPAARGERRRADHRPIPAPQPPAPAPAQVLHPGRVHEPAPHRAGDGLHPRPVRAAGALQLPRRRAGPRSPGTDAVAV